MKIRPIEENDTEWIRSLLTSRWGSTDLVSRGKLRDGLQLPGFVAMESNQRFGLVTYVLDGAECEIETLDSLVSGKGIGSALINAVIDLAGSKGCSRVWLITTNDNTHALRFYQRFGFELVVVHRGAINQSRKLKPAIPVLGNDDIPIRDEIELEIKIK